MLARFFKIPLWQRTAAGFVLGIIAGLILRERAEVWLQPIGDVYLNLIRMVVAPLVLFTIASSISALTALDFLGFGLPPPTPSWGELLRQGTSNLQAPWIVASAFSALVIVLVLVTFVGEAIREAFDPKKFTLYR